MDQDATCYAVDLAPCDIVLHGYLGSPESTVETASRSAYRFAGHMIVSDRLTKLQTDRQIHRSAASAITNRIKLVVLCGVETKNRPTTNHNNNNNLT